MATNEADNNRRGAAPAGTARKSNPGGERKAIQAPAAPSEMDRLSVFGAIFATFVSMGANCLLLLLLWLLPGSGQADTKVNLVKLEQAKAKADEEKKEEEAKEEKLPDLTVTTIGDPEQPMSDPNFLNEKLDEVVAPGPANPMETSGIETDQRPLERDVITAPKGLGGGDPTGQSIGIMGPDGKGLTGGDTGFANGGFKNGIGDSWTGAFPGRSGSMKDKLLSEGGGNGPSEAAVAEGLRWLALHQAQDGHWSLTKFNQSARTAPYPAGKVGNYSYGANMGLGTVDDDVAATALALLPFLAAGQTHKANKDEQRVRYDKGVLAGITFLISKQVKTPGAQYGMLSSNFYAHGIATIALCEAYGLTSDPMLKLPAQRALDYIVATQHDAGGWRYRAKEAGDLSATGWQLMALKSGQMSGLKVPAPTLKGAERFVDSCEDKDTGTYGYLPNGGGTPSMTATGMLCRQYLGVNPRNPKLLKGVEFIKQSPPNSQDLYYLYYATQVMHHMGGEAWNFWNKGPKGTGDGGIRDTLVNNMDRSPLDGPTAMQRGSWHYPNGHTAAGGRLMSTSLSLLCLEVYYRHLPLYRGEVTEDKPMN